jgi:translation initiation factor eIF-2B subunit beta
MEATAPVSSDPYHQLTRNLHALSSRQLVGSRATALETLLVLRQVISKSRFSNMEQLVAIIRSVGRRLVEAQPKGLDVSMHVPYVVSLLHGIEHSVGNTVRKVLHHIREEYHTAINGTAAASYSGFSISKFVLLGQPRKHTPMPKAEAKGTLKENDPDDPDSFARSLKPVLMEAIQDVLDDLETVYDNVSKSAQNHIHSE